MSGGEGYRRTVRGEAGASPKAVGNSTAALLRRVRSSVMAYVRTLADFPDSLAEVVSDGVDWAGLGKARGGL